VVVVDATTLIPIAPAIPELTGDRFSRPPTAAHKNAGLFAVGAGGLLVVVDAVNGAKRFQVSLPSRVTAVAFDPDRDVVLAGTEHGDVVSVDLASEAVVAEFALAEPFEVEALGARDDGVVVVVGDAWIELFDPEGRSVGAPIAVPASEESRVRRDGTVVLVPPDDVDTILVIDPTGAPLAEQGWTVDPDALVAFGAGSAGVVGQSGAEVVDLASGERASVDLTLPGGDRFDPVAIVPEAEGYLAWDSGRTVARWRDTGVVEQIDLWSATGTVNLGPDDPGEEWHAGDGFVAAGAAAVFLRDNANAVYRFDPTPGELALRSTLRSPPVATAAAAPAPDGGLHLVLDTGVVRTYDTSARRTGEVETGLSEPALAVADPASGLVALGGEHGAAILDPSTEAVQLVGEAGAIRQLGFARDGRMLVVVETDGTVRLWDIERAQPIGTLWTGTGTAPPAPPWYDPSTNSVWVATSGTILQFSLDPERWADRACELVSRELTPEEWDHLVPGDAPQRPACD
jgi:WD40 repeat protein